MPEERRDRSDEPRPKVARSLLLRGVKFDVEMLEYTGGRGRLVRREFLRHAGSVIVLPILDDGRIVMIRNFRAALEREIWELPAGTRSDEEPPEHCALRELEEETGYRASRLDALTDFWTAPGLSDERMHAYIARGLKRTVTNPEEDELIRVEPVTPRDATAMLDRGEIADAKTILVLLWALRKGILTV
jgi:ADP-ribose pyrophosphatase